MISKGAGIFWHSVVMVYSNLRVALHMSVPPILVGIIAMVIIGMVYFAGFSIVPLAPFVVIAINIVLAIVISCIIAIRWHRFVLLDEVPAKSFSGLANLNLLEYGVYLFKTGVILLLISIPFIALNMRNVWQPDIVPAINDNAMMTSVLMVLSNFIITYVGLRLTIGLPAIAVEAKRLAVGQSWEFSKKFHMVVLIGAACMVALNMAANLFLGLFQFFGTGFNAFSIAFVLLSVIFSWFLFLVSISILTSFYGHYVEERAI